MWKWTAPEQSEITFILNDLNFFIVPKQPIKELFISSRLQKNIHRVSPYVEQFACQEAVHPEELGYRLSTILV